MSLITPDLLVITYRISFSTCHLSLLTCHQTLILSSIPRHPSHSHLARLSSTTASCLLPLASCSLSTHIHDFPLLASGLLASGLRPPPLPSDFATRPPRVVDPTPRMRCRHAPCAMCRLRCPMSHGRCAICHMPYAICHMANAVFHGPSPCAMCDGPWAIAMCDGPWAMCHGQPKQ